MKETDVDMPQVLQIYYAAKNRHDVESMAECFADDAVVRDEGEDLRGKDPIKQWMSKTTEAYCVQVEVRKVVEQGPEVAVTALVSGNFDGSPLEMYYDFTLGNDKIRSLSITA